jgi:hypothetical protein
MRDDNAGTTTVAPLELQDNAAVGAHDSDARLTATRFAPVIAAAQEPPFAVSVEYYRQRGTVGRRGVTVGESAWSQGCGARPAASVI